MRKRRNTVPPLVFNTIVGSANPLVSITFISPSNPLEPGIHYIRMMGFIVEKFDNGLRLVATCKHGVSFFYMQGYKAIMVLKNPKSTMLMCVGYPIEDPLAENDVAFLLVRDTLNAPIAHFVLHEKFLPIKDGQNLYNAQNRCDPFRGIYKVPVASQVVFDSDKIAFCKLTTNKGRSYPVRMKWNNGTSLSKKDGLAIVCCT